MISNEAQELNSTFRRDLKESGTFDGPIEEVRAAWDAFGDSMPAYAPDVSIEPVDAGGVSAEWVTMPGVTGNRVLLHFHGGGYVIGRPSTYRNFNARMSEAANARVLAPDYRLAPEHPFPAAVDDTLAAYKWALEQGHAPENIGFMGESAGGGLVLATLLAARDSGLPMPAAAVATSPWFDLGNNGPTHTSNAEADPMIGAGSLDLMAKNYLNGQDGAHPLASPLNGHLSGLPPIFIMTGGTEVLLDDTRMMFARLCDAGVDARVHVAPEMPHIWPIFAFQIPEGRAAIARMAGFFGEYMA